jgi:hypothetical protein
VLASHEIQIDVPATIAVGATGAGTLSVTNRMTIPTSGVTARVSIPGNTAGPETNEIPIGVMEPGSSYQTAFDLAYASPGRQFVEVEVQSAEGERVRKQAAVEVYDPEKPAARISLGDIPEFFVGASGELAVTVWNDDVVSMEGIIAELRADDEVTVTTAQQPVPTLAPGEQTELCWTLQGAGTGICNFSVVLRRGGSTITECSRFLVVKDASNEFELQVAPEVLPSSGVSSAAISLRCQIATNVSVEVTGTPGVDWGLYSGGQPVEPGTFPVEGERVLELRVTPAGGAGPITITARPEGDLSGTDTKTVWVPDSSTTAKRDPDGELVYLVGTGAAGLVVSAVFDDCFYVEEADRSSGIRVAPLPGVSVAVRDKLLVRGLLGTSSDGERYIQAQSIQNVGQAPTPTAPLGMANRALGGGDWEYDPLTGAGQRGVSGGCGLNNIGLLVRAWGRVAEIEQVTPATWFRIGDGSGVNVKCVVPSGVTIDPGWQHVCVTGVSSCEQVGGELRRLLRVRTQGDILSLPNP